MKIKQYVMAYSADHNQIKELLGDGYQSLRPVLRINVEIIGDDEYNSYVRIEFNTPVAAKGKRGWLNLMLWESPKTPISINIEGKTTEFTTDFLTIKYTGVGIEGGCPAENDNDGCFYLDDDKVMFIQSEVIDSNKEYCDCEFQWTKPMIEAMKIERKEILGAYQVEFERNE